MVPVPCRPLLTLVRHHTELLANGSITGCPKSVGEQEKVHDHRDARRLHSIQYMSLDVEGAELRVLQSVIELPRHPFQMMMVECQYENQASHMVQVLLNQSGYIRIPSFPKAKYGGANCLYVAPTLAPAAHRLSKQWYRQPKSINTLMRQLDELNVRVD